MRLPIFQCDLCKKRHEENEFWWNNAHGGEFTVCRDGTNGAKKWEHLCPPCRELLCGAVQTVIDSVATTKVAPPTIRE